MMSIKRLRIALILFFLLFCSSITGCVTPSTVTTWVQLNRERYVCKSDPSKYTEYRGKSILLSTIIDESKNTSNFHYYNPEQTVGYALFYSSTSMQQPVVSFYWYALQKAFGCMGIEIEESNRFPAAELALVFKSVTDEEIQFDAGLIKKSSLIYTKRYAASIQKVQTRQVDALEQRAYGMLDSIVTTILSDPGFHDAFFSAAAAPAPAQADPRYSSIRGVVLKTGEAVIGKIIIMNVYEVKIQVNDGRILTYSFDKDVQSFIKD